MRVEKWYIEIEYIVRLNREERYRLLRIIGMYLASCKLLKPDETEKFARELKEKLEDE